MITTITTKAIKTRITIIKILILMKIIPLPQLDFIDINNIKII